MGSFRIVPAFSIDGLTGVVRACALRYLHGYTAELTEAIAPPALSAHMTGVVPAVAAPVIKRNHKLAGTGRHQRRWGGMALGKKPGPKQAIRYL